jgi:hypothetical protein
VLFCSFNAPAELGCYLELGWPLAENILDLCIEHRLLVNGVLDKKQPRDLLAAMAYYNLPRIEMIEKHAWRNLILTGGPFDAEQRAGILEYCWTDIRALELLLPTMLRSMPTDLDRALYRARYTIPVTAIMRAGIPVDEVAWRQLHDMREEIQREITADCPIYDGATFKYDRFQLWLANRGLLERWQHTKSGRLSTSDATFREFAAYPEVDNLRRIRQVIDHFRKPGFEVRAGRNHFSILPFKAETSRNATIGCIFQSPAWLRGLIQPKPGMALAYVDYEQEEFLIAGVHAGDEAVLKAYATGDPYVSFGVSSGLIPPGGSKKSHPNERKLAKTLLLAVLYGMTSRRLAERLGVSQHRAEDLLEAHHRVFRKLYDFSMEQVRSAYWRGIIETHYGWNLKVTERTKERTLLNFRVQGDGAEILRLACIFLWERGVRVCAPVHDAVLVECAENDLEDVVQEVQRQMVAGPARMELPTHLRISDHPRTAADGRRRCLL